MSLTRIEHEFVDSIPDALEELTAYVCIRYATVVHLCCCGCGTEVVTPLGLTDWRLTYDGETISLAPSIGNWSLLCRSHYWIERGTIRWAPSWSDDRVRDGRVDDLRRKREYFDDRDTGHVDALRTSSRVRRPSHWLRRLFGRGS